MRTRSQTWVIAALASSIALAGCEAPREAELLGIADVSPERLEPGRTIVVEGAGFPPGRSGSVRFTGTSHRPGRAPVEVRVEVTGRALSAERVEARFTRDALEAMGGRGTLHGHVWAVFETRDGQGTVVGRSARLELDVSTASGIFQRPAGCRPVRQWISWLSYFGLRIRVKIPRPL